MASFILSIFYSLATLSPPFRITSVPAAPLASLFSKTHMFQSFTCPCSKNSYGMIWEKNIIFLEILSNNIVLLLLLRLQ